ncbi:hypothetical protein ACH5RR_018538, partial [Cinchona calisaya]
NFGQKDEIVTFSIKQSAACGKDGSSITSFVLVHWFSIYFNFFIGSQYILAFR